MEEYTVYVQVNPGSCVVALTSSALLAHTEGWVEVERGPGDRCHHPQSNYLPLPLYTDEGVPRYKLVGGAIVERTLEELEADLAGMDLAKRYYPRLWDDRRLDMLVAAGQLTQQEVEEVKEGAHETAGDGL